MISLSQFSFSSSFEPEIADHHSMVGSVRHFCQHLNWFELFCDPDLVNPMDWVFVQASLSPAAPGLGPAIAKSWLERIENFIMSGSIKVTSDYGWRIADDFADLCSDLIQLISSLDSQLAEYLPSFCVPKVDRPRRVYQVQANDVERRTVVQLNGSKLVT